MEKRIVFGLLCSSILSLSLFGADVTTPPKSPVRIVFVHHSTGENWLSDFNGGLGIALRDNNYFVSDTNYGWGPDSIGDTTDIGHWWQWFRSGSSPVYTAALYSEAGQNCEYSRAGTGPVGENAVVMFKSCFPNSALRGYAGMPVPPIDQNPLRNQGSGSEDHTVGNAKGIYIDILEYFRSRQDKLFVVIAAPPLSDGEFASNAREFNSWLEGEWLAGYPFHNVFVFDFYNVLTTNGGSSDTNDLGAEGGNHHRWWLGGVQHQADPAFNTLAYPSGDDHPSQAGNLKATGEYLELLNVAYHRFIAEHLEKLAPDFNADKKADVLWRNRSTGEVYAWYMDGAAHVGGGSLGAVADPSWRVAGSGDFSGDGKTDVLWRNYATGENYAWFMDGASHAGGAPLETVADTSWEIAGTGDFNFDLKPDVLWRNASTGENCVWYMDGVARAGVAILDQVPDTDWEIVGAGDFNWDGKTDVLWRNASSGENYAWYMDGASRVGGGPVEAVPDMNWSVGWTGDLDGDGGAGLLWRNTSTGENALWAMSGISHVGTTMLDPVPDQAWRMWDVSGTPPPQPFVRSDFDGDGKADVLWWNEASGELCLWAMDGVSRRGAGTSVGAVGDTSWTVAGMDDFNADGKTDLLWRNRTTGENYVWYMDWLAHQGGDPVEPVADSSWQVTGTGDFNADGRPDILWRNSSTGENYVWYMIGAAHAGGAPLGPVPDLDWRIAGAADFTGDGKPDLLWRNAVTGQVYIWIMDGVAKTGGADLGTVPTEWEIAWTADYNLDGKPDILWRNFATGENFAWFMDGTAQSGGAYLEPVPDTAWWIMAASAHRTTVADVALDKRVAVLLVGGSEQLSATLAPANATDRRVAWSSSAPEVARVSESGLVSAVGVGGATITVTSADGGRASTCAVVVPDALDVTSFGAVGDGLTECKEAIDSAILSARASGKGLYFPDGTYLYHSPANWNGVRFFGQSEERAIIEGSSREEHNLDGAENMTFRDLRITDYGTTKSRVFKNCTFVATVEGDKGFYFFYTGAYTWGADNEFTDCNFVFNDIYAALWVRKYDSVIIKNCKFTGDAFHNIRLSEPNISRARAEVIGNDISGGTTGVFVGSDRVAPLEGGLIEGNTLRNQKEESISLDGIGNDPGFISVIANGPISSAANDAGGNLVVGMDGMSYCTYIDHLGNIGFVPSPVSVRDDWTSFYFSFGEGSGLEGTVAKIASFDTGANTLTLGLQTDASSVKVGGDGGVQGGFFDWTIRGNTVEGALGSGNTYGTAISVYLNVFGTLVENNTVRNCAHGVNLAGGLMFSGYRTLAYHNTIRGNSFIDCDQFALGDPSEETGVVRIVSYWSGSGPVQYGNSFVGNTVVGGRMFIERQDGFAFDDNQLIGVNLVVVPVNQ